MDSTEQYIESYLEGKLSGDEERNFEEKMNQDAAFKKEVELQREINKSLREQVDVFKNLAHFGKLDQQLSGEKSEEEYIAEAEKLLAEEEEDESDSPIIDISQKKKSSFLLIAILAAASLALLFFFFFPENPKQDYDFLAMGEKHNEENRIVHINQEKSIQGDIKVQRQKAVVALNKQQYKEAITLWSEILEENPADPDARLYLGFAYLKNGNPVAAKEVLSTTDGSGYNRDQVQWNLIICYLLLDDRPKLTETVCSYLNTKFKYNRSKIEEIKRDFKLSCDS